MSRVLPVMAKHCPTCPFHPNGSEYADLAGYLAERSETESRICHSTGTSAIEGCTGRRERVCRGARDIQLQRFVAMGFLPEATDKAWAAKVAEMGIA